MNVLHRDVKLANILIHFREVDQKMVIAGGNEWKQYKKKA